MEGQVEIFQREKLDKDTFRTLTRVVFYRSCLDLILEYGLNDLLDRYFDSFFSFLLVFILILSANSCQTVKDSRGFRAQFSEVHSLKLCCEV